MKGDVQQSRAIESFELLRSFRRTPSAYPQQKSEAYAGLFLERVYVERMEQIEPFG